MESEDNYTNTLKKSFFNLKDRADLAELINDVNLYKKFLVNNNFEITLELLNKYTQYSDEYYSSFKIVKKSGGSREINTPNIELKAILRSLNYIFQNIFETHESSHGFVNNKSIVTNSKVHTNKNYIYNIDLNNFFPSICISRIYDSLQKNISWGNKIISNYELMSIVNQISELSTFKTTENSIKVLPQGSPLSPILSNIVCFEMDKDLSETSKEYGVTYTRYADDITFSSMINSFDVGNIFLKKITMIIEKYDFSINDKKTRLQNKDKRQSVTGLVVNEKVNVKRIFIKELRSLIHLVNKYGIGMANYIYKSNGLKKQSYINNKSNTIPNINDVIIGKLLFLKMVKGYDNSTYLTLKNKYEYISSKVDKNRKKILWFNNDNYINEMNSTMLDTVKYFKIDVSLNIDESSKLEIEELYLNKSPIFGLIKYYETHNAFLLSGFYSESKYKAYNKLFKFIILTNSIPLNKKFFIINLVERVDSNTQRNYYRELLVTIKDSQGNTRDFKFHKDPNNEPFSANELKLYLNELKELLSDSKSFKEFDIRIMKLIKLDK